MTKQKGFSAIEILVALAVLAILAGVAWVWQKQQKYLIPVSPLTTSVPTSPQTTTPTTFPSIQPTITQPFTPTMEAKLTIVLQPSPVVKQGWTQQSSSELNLTYQLPPEDGWIDIPHPENSSCALSLDRNSGDQFICIEAFENSSGGRRKSFCQNRFRYMDFDTCASYFCSVREVRVGNRDALKIHFCSGGSDSGTYYVLTNQSKTIVISDYAALYPWIKNKPKTPWEELRDEIISTFWFD